MLRSVRHRAPPRGGGGLRNEYGEGCVGPLNQTQRNLPHPDRWIEDAPRDMDRINIAAAGAVDQEFGHIFRFFYVFLRFWAENELTEVREGFKKVPGGRRIHSG